METGASLVVYMVKNSPAMREFDPRVGKIPWRREWLPTPLFLPEEFHGQRSLVGYCQWHCKDSDLTEQLTLLKWKSLAHQDPNQDERWHCTRVPNAQLMPALGLVTSAHGFLLCAPASDSLVSPSWKRRYNSHTRKKLVGGTHVLSINSGLRSGVLLMTFPFQIHHSFPYAIYFTCIIPNGNFFYLLEIWKNKGSGFCFSLASDSQIISYLAQGHLWKRNQPARALACW